MLLKSAKSIATPSRSQLPMTGAMLTHPGCVRDTNEDAVAYVLPIEAGSRSARGALALVADGMGGHAAGEVASRTAADLMLRLYYQLEGLPPKVLASCFAQVNRAIYERGRRDQACAGMGTTCTVLAFSEGAAYLGHIGDSRAYLLRGGTLRQLSEDHSLVAQLVRDGAMTEEEAARSPERNVILRALGTEPIAEPSISQEGLLVQAGDVFVLCSDGLSDVISDEAIEEAVRHFGAFEACRALIDQALAAGGPDNVSVGVIAVGGCGPAREAPRDTRPIEIPGGVR